MAEATTDLTERKFGYPVPPPYPPPYPPPQPPFPPPGPIPPGMTVLDWVHYINSYVDVRARQIYEKLKSSGGGGSWDGSTPLDYVLLRDVLNRNNIYKVYIKNGTLYSEPQLT